MFSPIRIAVVLVAVSGVCLSGCGGSSSDNDAQIRVLNVSQGYSSLDVYAGTTKEQSAIAYGGVSSYFGLGSGTYTLQYTVNGVSTSLKSEVDTFSAKTHQTFVAYGDTGNFATLDIGEDNRSPASGDADVQIVNAAPDAGAVDVYFTASTTSLENASPQFSSVAASSINSSGFTAISDGTYRMRVTAAGSKTDVRLDVASVTLSSESVQSVIISDTSGGVLVNALVLPQRGSLTTDNNPDARVRAVAGTLTGNSVTVGLGGVSLLSSAAPGTIGNYSLVSAGTASTSLTVGGAAISAADQNLTAGADYTLLVWTDSSGTTQESLISEANGLPASGSAKIRLVNAMSALGNPLSMAVSYTSEAESVALGNASAFATVGDGSNIPLGVTDTTTSASLYSSNVVLSTQGVYTMFMFGSSSSPTGTLQADR